MKRESVLRILLSATLLLALATGLTAAHFVGAAQGPTPVNSARVLELAPS